MELVGQVFSEKRYYSRSIWLLFWKKQRGRSVRSPYTHREVEGLISSRSQWKVEAFWKRVPFEKRLLFPYFWATLIRACFEVSWKCSSQCLKIMYKIFWFLESMQALSEKGFHQCSHGGTLERFAGSSTQLRLSQQQCCWIYNHLKQLSTRKLTEW